MWGAIPSLLLAAGVAAAQVATETAFGYTNTSGTRLLMLSDDGIGPSTATARTMQTAICSEARQFSIRYLRLQEQSPGGTARQSASNFDFDGGHLYELVGPSGAPDDTCLLVPAGFLDRYPVVRRDPPMEELSQRIAGRLRQQKGRDIKSYYPLYSSGSAQQFAAVEYVPIGDRLLVSFVLTKGDRIFSLDWPADRRETDCWRVEDGCVFDVGEIEVPAILDNGDNPLIFFTGQGAEGLNAVLYEARDGGFAEIHRAYRYQAPN